ncbi:MAG TPA: hypothetical protein VN872_04920 [Candidatus Acidoferrum sp.]|nr:hypothetical protein [Candidatus Acidoferrum sp.]
MRANFSIQSFEHHLTSIPGEETTMDDKNKMDQQSGRPNRDQETEKKPSQGSEDVNRQGQGNVQQGQQGQRDQQDREKKPA